MYVCNAKHVNVLLSHRKYLDFARSLLRKPATKIYEQKRITRIIYTRPYRNSFSTPYINIFNEPYFTVFDAFFF